MSLQNSNHHDWQYLAELSLPSSSTVDFQVRWREVDHPEEGEAQLVWQRPGQRPLFYLISRVLPPSATVVVRARADQQAIVVFSQSSMSLKSSPVASLDLLSGEYQSLSVFLAPPPETAWAIVWEEEGVLIDMPLSWAQDEASGLQRLWLYPAQLLWERRNESDWTLVQGHLETKDFPCPASPYRRQPPGWVARMGAPGSLDGVG